MLRKLESQIGDGSEGMLYAAAISPDGKYLAMAGYPVSTEKGNYIVVIHLEKNLQVATAEGHQEIITSLSFSGDGKYLASGSADRTVKVWQMEERKTLIEATTITTNYPVSSISFNPQTTELAVGNGGKDIAIYNIGLLASSDKKLVPKFLKKHKSPINKLTYSPDGQYLISCSEANELILWKSGNVEKEFDVDKTINALAFSSDSKILATLDVSGRGYSWSLPSGNLFTEYNGHDNTVFSASFSPSTRGNYVVASAGGIDNEIHLWNPINGATIRKIKGRGRTIHDLVFGEGMDLFVAQTLKNKKPVFESSFNYVSLMANRHLAKQPDLPKHAADVQLIAPHILQIGKGKKVEIDPYDRILDYVKLRNGNVIIASDFSLRMFDANGYLLKEFIGHYGAVRAVALTKDERYFASGGEDQTIILWKLDETGVVPSIRDVYKGEDWRKFFESLPVDTSTYLPSKKAWNDVITFLKGAGNKTSRDFEETYRGLGEVGVPFTTLFLSDDQEWVNWTPSGYFACSSAGGQYFGWHVNKGIHQLADFYEADQYFELLYRPRELSKGVQEGKRVDVILKEAGERIFDLSKLHRPSVAFFDLSATTRATDLIRYENGKLVTQARTIPITIDVYDGGGGVKEINIYQNDKLIISESNIKTEQGQKLTKTFAVDMVNELNEFKVKVINYQRMESKPDVLKIEFVGDIIPNSSLNILAIGINQYQNSSYNLNYARPDAESFLSKLKEQEGGIFKSVNITSVYDADATKDNILKAFNTISKEAKAEDVFIFFYAGHGTLDEENNDEYYLVPTDITKLYGDPTQLANKGISATELRKLLTQIKSQKQIILMDACHSGGALKSLNVRSAAMDEKAIVQLARSSGVVMIASSGSKQFATEFEVLKHGVFTYTLLEGLNGKADNGDGKITVNELKIYMEERVPELTKQHGGTAQYPTGYITGNDFPISILRK
jgi:WD40 repeat protein